MTRVLTGKRIWNRIGSSNPFRLYRNRTFCSSTHNNKPTAINTTTTTTNNGSPPSPSLSNYSEQYKALSNLDFMTAAKILFSDPPKQKKFGYVFSLCFLFRHFVEQFVCNEVFSFCGTITFHDH